MNYKFDSKTDKRLEFGIVINKPLEIVGENSVIDGSNAARLFRVESPDVSIKNLNLINSKIDDKGAAIYWHGTNGKLENCLLEGNLGRIGGAVFVGSTKLTIDSCKFIKNYATYRGGAVYVGNKNTKIVNNLFKDNQAVSGYNKAIYWGDRKWISLYKNNTFINNTQFDKGGNSEDYNEYIQPAPQYNGIEYTTYRVIDKITVHNKQISIKDNKLTLGVLNQIFDKDFRNGHLRVYIDGLLVFNATTTDDLLQIIFDLLNLLPGNHRIKMVFTGNDGKTNTYTVRI